MIYKKLTVVQKKRKFVEQTKKLVGKMGFFFFMIRAKKDVNTKEPNGFL